MILRPDIHGARRQGEVSPGSEQGENGEFIGDMEISRSWIVMGVPHDKNHLFDGFSWIFHFYGIPHLWKPPYNEDQCG